ncbi:MAG: helix-turn-helix domain-containing protein [Lacrimispora celerecrescens]|nr:helix-turn-helix domain-containing protein [Lacrimispora celerecrescens]
MARTKFLIINSNLPIDDLSHEVGYNNLSFFYKKFSELFGFKPGEYRKSCL